MFADKLKNVSFTGSLQWRLKCYLLLLTKRTQIVRYKLKKKMLIPLCWCRLCVWKTFNSPENIQRKMLQVIISPQDIRKLCLDSALDSADDDQTIVEKLTVVTPDIWSSEWRGGFPRQTSVICQDMVTLRVSFWLPVTSAWTLLVTSSCFYLELLCLWEMWFYELCWTSYLLKLMQWNSWFERDLQVCLCVLCLGFIHCYIIAAL